MRVEVFDVAGRRVAVLADGSYGAGRHELYFRADRLASGLYFVRAVIDAGDESGQRRLFTQKVTLVK